MKEMIKNHQKKKSSKIKRKKKKKRLFISRPKVKKTEKDAKTPQKIH